MVYPPGATFGPRRLDDFEFVWIVEGRAVAHYNGQRIEAPENTVLLPRPGMIDRYEWDTRRRTVHAFFHFNFTVPSRGWPPLRQWPLSRLMPQDDILRPLFRFALNASTMSAPARSILVRPSVELMLRCFVSGKLTTATETAADLPPPVEKALEAIRAIAFQQPPRPVTLADLARTAHVTPEHLCRLFRKHLDCGPLECARLARLQSAATLLDRTNMAVKEIAAAVGFISPYHFSRAFRAAYQLPPKEYRRAVREGRPVRPSLVARVLPKPIPRMTEMRRDTCAA